EGLRIGESAGREGDAWRPVQANQSAMGARWGRDGGAMGRYGLAGRTRSARGLGPPPLRGAARFCRAGPAFFRHRLRLGGCTIKIVEQVERVEEGGDEIEQCAQPDAACDQIVLAQAQLGQTLKACSVAGDDRAAAQEGEGSVARL